MYSNVLTFPMSKDRIKITQKLAPTVIFLDQCHSSEMLLIATIVVLSASQCCSSYRQLFASLARLLSVIMFLRYCIRHIAEVWADFHLNEAIFASCF